MVWTSYDDALEPEKIKQLPRVLLTAEERETALECLRLIEGVGMYPTVPIEHALICMEQNAGDFRIVADDRVLLSFSEADAFQQPLSLCYPMEWEAALVRFFRCMKAAKKLRTGGK